MLEMAKAVSRNGCMRAPLCRSISSAPPVRVVYLSVPTACNRSVINAMEQFAWIFQQSLAGLESALCSSVALGLRSASRMRSCADFGEGSLSSCRRELMIFTNAVLDRRHPTYQCETQCILERLLRLSCSENLHVPCLRLLDFLMQIIDLHRQDILGGHLNRIIARELHSTAHVEA